MQPLRKNPFLPVLLAAAGSVAGTWIGPYRVSGLLGEGGMSKVYLAQDAGPRRPVALKVLRPGMDESFECERQALARTRHENVVRLIDTGTTSAGEPFLAMELVRGSAITDFCDGHRLGVKDRLGLFLQLCDGVAHLHGKGILHRDLKPANILASNDAASPRAKVIDLGLADFTDRGAAAKPALIGTVGYMSPEQTDPRAGILDVRTDVYALGVVLYELLVGELPFCPKELAGEGILEMRRRLARERPLSPREKLSRLGEGAVRSAHARDTSVRSLERILGGRVGEIVMRALDPDPESRFQTVCELRAAVKSARERLV